MRIDADHYVISHHDHLLARSEDGQPPNNLINVSSRLPHIRVLILTTFEHDDYIFGALHAGASGCLLKRTQPGHLIDAIHTVADGEALLSPSVTRTVIRHVAG